MRFPADSSARLAAVAAAAVLIGCAGASTADACTPGVSHPPASARRLASALPPSAADAQSDLRNAQTVVEAWANGNGGRYPSSASTRRGESLRAALPKDPDATYLPDVYFSAPAGQATADTYDLWAWSASNHTVYELSVRRGVARYGSVPRVRKNPTRTDPSTSITNWSSSPWES